MSAVLSSKSPVCAGPCVRRVVLSTFAFGLLLATLGATSEDSYREAEKEACYEPPLIERPWTLHDGKHWQLLSSVSEEPEISDAIENTRGACPIGMVAVQGRRKVDPGPFALEHLQRLTCTDWISTTFPERCAAFDPGAWEALLTHVQSTQTAFCIDRYEYPNVKGQYPWVFVTWNEAEDLCARTGKRLCSEDEWTFACEGEAALPYPYGFARSADACVIDRPWREYREREFADRHSESALAALDRIFQGEPSGSRPLCRSPWGVYDMTGNVDEWTRGTLPNENQAVLKGGYWGPVRARCRPGTRAHSEHFAYYQQGFRCCADWPRR